MKKLLLLLCFILTVNLSANAAQTTKSPTPVKKVNDEIKFAQSDKSLTNVGSIDINQVLVNYVKYQDLQSNQKISAAEIQEYTATAQKEINAAKSQDEKKKLIEKHAKEIEKKKDAFKDQYGKQIEALKYNINLAIKTVAQNKKLPLVFKNDSLIYGGIDITNDVIVQINKN